MNAEPRISRRARWLSAMALVSVCALGIVGCTTDTAELAKKAAGDDPLVQTETQQADPDEPAASGTDADTAADASSEMPDDLEDTVDPIDEEAGKASDAKPSKVKAGAAHEDTSRLRIHLQILSMESDVTFRGETYKNPDTNGQSKECVDPKTQKSLGIPKRVDKVVKGVVSHVCMESAGMPSLELTYNIPGTTDLFWIYTTVPAIGQNRLLCSVIDPRTWETNINSPYTCDAQWLQDNGHGDNPMPKVKLRKKPTVKLTDNGEAQDVLKQYCSKGQTNCDFTEAKRVITPSPKSEWKVLDTYNNCGPDKKHPAMHSWKKQRKFGWENSVGLSFSVEGELPWGKFNAGGGAGFEAAWEFSNTYENTVKQPVPWGYADIFYLQVNYLRVTGDILISTKDKNYELKNVTYRLPLAEAWKDERGQIVPMSSKYAVGVKITCPATSFVGSTGTKMLDGTRTPAADKI